MAVNLWGMFMYLRSTKRSDMSYSKEFFTFLKKSKLFIWNWFDFLNVAYVLYETLSMSKGYIKHCMIESWEQSLMLDIHFNFGDFDVQIRSHTRNALSIRSCEFQSALQSFEGLSWSHLAVALNCFVLKMSPNTRDYRTEIIQGSKKRESLCNMWGINNLMISNTIIWLVCKLYLNRSLTTDAYVNSS